VFGLPTQPWLRPAHRELGVVSLTSWRGSGINPDATDQHREDLFLDQHLSGGALIHITTSEAVASALAEETDDEERARLTLRIFAEYVNALETLGAWGWAIRHRSSSRLLLDAFLSYAPGDVKAFYKTVSFHTGELAQLLRLPATQVITDEFRRVGVPHGKLLAEFSRVESNLTQAAEHYFDHQELFLANYNKAKHGAPIIRTSDLAQQEFYVLAPDLSGSKRYQFTKFNSEPHAVRKYVGLTKQVSETSRALVSFARKLKTVGLLY
jgi:hypothetical protein